MSDLTTTYDPALARADLCHICRGEADDTCEACGRRVCLACSSPDHENPVRFCRGCLEEA